MSCDCEPCGACGCRKGLHVTGILDPAMTATEDNLLAGECVGCRTYHAYIPCGQTQPPAPGDASGLYTLTVPA